MSGPLLVALAHVGCSSDSETGCDDSCLSAGSDDDDFTSSQASSSGGPSTGTGATGGDGNDTFETATEIELNQAFEAELSPSGDVDFYSFQGVKGQVLLFDIDAQDLDNRPFDPSYIDTVLTLFDGARRAVAEATGPIPKHSGDPQLYTILPADGTYVLRVEECWQWSSDPETDCAAPEVKQKVGYSLLAVDVEAVELSGLTIVGETEPNDDPAAADAVAYGKTSGVYEYTDLYGTFTSPTDVDTFAFALPDDTVVSSGRATATFWPLPDGATGNGSTTPPGKIALVDPLGDPGSHFAEIDASLGQRLAPPVNLAQSYQLVVQHPGGEGGFNDFYFIRHFGAGSNPLESADATNNLVASAEPLAKVDNKNGTYSFYVEGDLTPAGVDIDHFQVDASVVRPGGHVDLICSAQRRGSGLRDLAFSLLAASNGEQLATQMESPSEDLAIVDVPIPGGESKLVLKVTAGAQAPNVTSTFYRCGVHFYPD